MNRLIMAAARHPWLFLAVLLVITALAAGRIGELRVSISVESMLERGTAAWRLFRNFTGILSSRLAQTDEYKVSKE